ncbi:MAG: Fic family protein [Candidatus Levybacteria bacterium]|nr:Fic family protein [Candidatus Levybacteria bacterium]
MEIPPQFTITNKIVTLLAKIEANKTYLNTLSIPEKIITNLTHLSLLKSSVYSAQIEGNTLTPDDYENLTDDEEKQYERQEVENIIQALTSIRENGVPDIIDIPYILHLHKLVMHKLVHNSQAGVIRKEPSAIFDNNGNVVYMTPPPTEINNLLINLLQLINESNDIFPLIKAPIVHLCFEKIHPFLDGNGRVGRLLFQAVLAKHGYHFKWLLSIEELLQQKKHSYYYLLEQNSASEFVEFILETLYQESERLKLHIDELTNPTEEDFLLPRRKEILAIIRDHTVVTVEQIQRRFLKVPARTLRYDIKQLEMQGLVRKIGTTRGAMYQVKKK